MPVVHLSCDTASLRVAAGLRGSRSIPTVHVGPVVRSIESGAEDFHVFTVAMLLLYWICRERG